ncbi:MAG TPA: hypothetical protein VGC13_33090 [Longimicrobium sp.]|uniref:hypothetical protein n=1 Tax=Longimicrobium sp. TaxID=2029185 RepID=UPI002EDA78CA
MSYRSVTVFIGTWMQPNTTARPDAATNVFSPREFLKTRRPEQFSDSVADETPILDRALLEFHLETLTSRGQETEFEHFARRLAERTICPNLLPQTGPTGGGDSHVDAETYPVADTLSLGWHVGIGRAAASERWAFAFSAKKDWRPKLRSDVDKIAKTERGYTKAFFVTNQSVRDRARAQVEDELRKKHKLDVRILDRTWILDRVFGEKLEGLAIDALRIAVSKKPEVRKGPRDAEREHDLEELEQRIAAALQEERLGPPMVEDCLDAVVLTRNLERPRIEVEGQLARAERIAARAGTDHQRLRSAYLWAWTAYFWYEDYPLFLKWYMDAEERGKNSRNSHDLELLLNLWNVLYTAARSGQLAKSEAAVPQHAQILTSALQRLSKEEGRPSITLHARTLLLQMRLVTSGTQDVEPVLRELGKVVREAEGLVGYPLEPVVEMLTEFGEVLDGNAAYEELFELVVEVASTREGELKGARMLLKRGAQQLDTNRPYEAIRTLGRVLRRLQKHESRDEFVQALYLCGAAYERTGLLWAARGTVLYAASVATNDFWTYSEFSLLQAACYRRLKWLELKLGRIPHVLAWHELDRVIRKNITGRSGSPEDDFDLEMRFALILGMLILRADLWQLKAMARLPDVLDSAELHFAAIALLYALGYDEDLPKEFVAQVPEGETLSDFFRLWLRQPAAHDVPDSPRLGDGRTVTLTSRVLGCRIDVQTENAPYCVALSESLLAAVESLFSTAIHENVIAREPTLVVNVRQGQFTETPFSFELADHAGKPHVEVRCASLNPHVLPLATQDAIGQAMADLLINIFARVFYVADPERVLRRLLRDENALERAIRYTTSLVTLGNVLGHEPRTNMSSWTRSDSREYRLLRTEPWNAQHGNADPRNAAKPAESVESRPELDPGFWDPERIKHTQMETVSLIREALWNKAGWYGAVYMWDLEELGLPVLGLLFRHATPPEQIFLQWREELGTRDTQERLRVVIVRGIDRTDPHAYRIVLGVNAQRTTDDETRVFLIYRHLRVDATTGVNLENFLDAFQQTGEYALAPALGSEGGSFKSLLPGYVLKREVHVREAWQIGIHDPDMVAINADEEPVIPENENDAPVLALIRWLRTQRP